MAYYDEEILRDKNGNPIPQYYDTADGKFKPLTEVQKTSLTGSNVELETRNNSRTQYEVAINSQSIPAGGALQYNFVADGESEVWFGVVIDQQPWGLKAGVITYPSAAFGYSGLYPQRRDVTQTTSPILPYFSLHMPIPPIAQTGFTEPTNMDEAKKFLVPPEDFELELSNDSSVTATATLSVIRVWR